MVLKHTDIEDVLVIYPDVHSDYRGYFWEVFNDKDFNEITNWKYNFHTVQMNESHSVANVIRGLHFQREEHAQAKLVRCTEGCVVDFAVDIREGSPTYGKFTYMVLNQEDHALFFIPKGFAHGFLVLSPEATFSYICDEAYDKESEAGIRWDDPEITFAGDLKLTIPNMVDSLLDSIEDVIVSEKDAKFLRLSEIYVGFNDKTVPYPYTHNEIDEQ